MITSLILKYLKDPRFYLIAALGLCFSMGFIGYDIPLQTISKLSKIFFVLFVIMSIISICVNFNNIFMLYRNNRKMFVFIILLVTMLLVFTKIQWAVVSLILMLVFYPGGYSLASKYLFFWSLLFFVVILSIGAIFPELGHESVGKVGSFFGSASGLEASYLGFGNPNHPLLYFVIIAINGGFVFVQSRYRRIYAISMMLFATVLYFLSLSRTSYVVIMIFLITYLLGSYKIHKFLKKAMPIIVILFTVASFLVAINYGNIGSPINDALTNRPYSWNLRVKDGIISNIMGNKDQYIDSTTESALDNNYINLIARHGWIVYIVVFYLLIIYKKEFDELYDEVYILGLFAMMVYFLSESMPFSMALCIVPIISIRRKFLSFKELRHEK